MQIEELALQVRINNWDELIRGFQNLADFDGQWIFRGQENSQWFHQTTLERAIRKFSSEMQSTTNSTDPGPDAELEHLRRVLEKGLGGRGNVTDGVFRQEPMTPLILEDGLLRRFKRQCHHYLTNTPEDQNPLEWLALMRHHGAPTRLVDWTYSFFVAVYFALVDAQDDHPPAVWAMECEEIGTRSRTILVEAQAEDIWECFMSDRNITHLSTFEKLFRREKPIPLVHIVNPYRLNPRLVIQQGVFLCQSDIAQPFIDNLTALWLVDPASSNRYLIKYTLEVTKSERIKILQNLHRMNMNRATLFPHLDGFAKSLEELLIFPNILQPHENLSNV